MTNFFDDDFTNETMGEPDRYWTNRSEGMEFAGYDDQEDGTTAWYDKSGFLDCVTDIPDEFEQAMNDAGY